VLDVKPVPVAGKVRVPDTDASPPVITVIGATSGVPFVSVAVKLRLIVVPQATL